MDSTPQTTIMYREDLARRLGISLDRLHFEIVQSGRLVSFEVLVDGQDLTPEQESVVTAFIADHDVMQAVFVATKA